MHNNRVDIRNTRAKIHKLNYINNRNQMDTNNQQEPAKPQMNQPLLQNSNQQQIPYFPQYSPPQNQVPQIHNPYEPLNLNYNGQNQNLPGQVVQQQQQLQQVQVVQHTQQHTTTCQPFQQQILQPFPQILQVLQNASGYRIPVLVACPYCNQNSITTISYKPGNNTFWMALLLCLCFGFLCLIPLLSSDCKDVIHQCSYCGKVVGITYYKPCE